MHTAPIAFWYHQGILAWDIGAHEFGGTGSSSPAEFDVVGATYIAVAPVGYVYDATQNTNYAARKYNNLADAQVFALPATATTPLVINIIGDWTGAIDNINTTFANTVTSAANYILIRTIGIARHVGVWDVTKYRLECAVVPLYFADNHVRVDGLQVRKTTTGALSGSIELQAIAVGNDTRISNCIIRQSGLNTNNDCGIYISAPEAKARIWNCIIYNHGGYAVIENAGIRSRSTQVVEIYSCTIIGGRRGISNIGYFGVYGTMIVKNCYAFGVLDAYYSYNPSSMILVDCASEDATGSLGMRGILHDASTFINVTPGSEDYRLLSNSPLVNSGTKTTGDATPLDFAIDIAGKTRDIPTAFSYTPPAIIGVWDIGAHEFAAGATTSPTEFDVAGATYYAVAPVGYVYDATQNTNYSARKYNTLFAAEAAITGTLTTPVVVNIIGDWTGFTDTTKVTILGATTSAANYVLIRAIGAARHDGVWSLSKYRLYTAGESITLKINHCRFDGLLVGKSASTQHNECCINVDIITTLNEVHISNCVCRQSGDNTYSEVGISIDDSQTIAFIWNCVSYGGSIYAGDQSPALNIGALVAIKVFSSTFIGGMQINGSFTPVTLRNCYITAFAGPFDIVAQTNCASGDTSGNTGLQNIPHSTATFVNVTPGSEDYRLVVGSLLIGSGVVINGDHSPINFTTDISGKARV